MGLLDGRESDSSYTSSSITFKSPLLNRKKLWLMFWCVGGFRPWGELYMDLYTHFTYRPDEVQHAQLVASILTCGYGIVLAARYGSRADGGGGGGGGRKSMFAVCEAGVLLWPQLCLRIPWPGLISREKQTLTFLAALSVNLREGQLTSILVLGLV